MKILCIWNEPTCQQNNCTLALQTINRLFSDSSNLICYELKNVCICTIQYEMDFWWDNPLDRTLN